MAKLINSISAVSPLGKAIDGGPIPRKIQQRRAEPGSPTATRWYCTACGRYGFDATDQARHLARELRSAIELLASDERAWFTPPPRERGGPKPQIRRHPDLVGVMQRCRSDCPPDVCNRHTWSYEVELPQRRGEKRRQFTQAGFSSAEAAHLARQSWIEIRKAGL